MLRTVSFGIGVLCGVRFWCARFRDLGFRVEDGALNRQAPNPQILNAEPRQPNPEAERLISS